MAYKFYGKELYYRINLTFEMEKCMLFQGIMGSGKALIAKALTGYIKLAK